MWDLELFASVTEHDKWLRWQLIRQFRDLGLDPKEQGDKLEIRFIGNREIVLRAVEVCEAQIIHDIHVWTAEH